jgi:hypothetical protein
MMDELLQALLDANARENDCRRSDGSNEMFLLIITFVDAQHHAKHTRAARFTTKRTNSTQQLTSILAQ